MNRISHCSFRAFRSSRLAALPLILGLLLATPLAAQDSFVLIEPDAPAWTGWALAGARDLSVAKDTGIEGDVHAGGNLDLAQGVVITGDASAVGRVQGQGRDGVEGTVTDFAAPVALPTIPSVDALRALADRVLVGDQRWDDVVIDDVVFVDGTVEIRGTLDGRGTLIAARDLRLLKGPQALGDDTLLSIIALGKLDVAKDRELRAFVRAARDVSIQKNARFEGVLLADGKIDIAKDSVVTFYGLDRTPPTLRFVEPTDGALVINEPAPAIVLELTDDGAGVDPDGFRLLLDPDGARVDLSLTCAGLETGTITCAPPRLAAGPRTLWAEAVDRAGNRATAELAFELVLDQAPPVIAVDGPSGVLYNQPSVVVSVSFADVDSAIDPASLEVTLDGAALTCGLRSVDGRVVGADCPADGLAAGPHAILARVADRVGQVGEAVATFELVLDSAPPALAVLTPAPGPRTQDDGTVEVSVRHVDAGSGLDLESLDVTLDGESIMLVCDVGEAQSECFLDLAAGAHALAAQITDRAGNTADVAVAFELIVDATAPTITILEPAGDLARDVTSTPLAIEITDAEGGLAADGLSVRLDGREIAGECSVSGSAAQRTVSCDADDLTEGTHALVVRQADRAGNVARSTRSFAVTLGDREAPSLEIVAPGAGRVVGLEAVEIVYSDASGIEADSLRVRLDGAALTCTADSDGATCAVPDVSAGMHRVEAEVRDVAGNRTRAEVAFDLELQLPVTITEPSSGTLVRVDEIEVRGAVDAVGADAAALEVDVAGVAADVAADGSWQVRVPLAEGANQLTAVARSASGAVGTASVQVVRDTEAPRPVIRTPPDGLVTTEPQIVVAGDVLAPSSSSTRQEPPAVEVLGLAAAVEQRAFVREDLLLMPGENPIEVLAYDAAGNVGRDQVTVTYLPNPARRLEVLLGNGQRGTVGEALPEPLVVRAVDSFGTPLPGREVVFEVSRGDGRVTAGDDSDRVLRVRTDVHGIAQVGFVLGRRSGEGNHEVTVRSPGLEGALLFCASAEPTAPARVVRIVGDIHLGALSAAADAEAPFPLRVQVFGALGNPLEGAAVSYRVTAGGGMLLGGDTGTDGIAAGEATVRTDSEGRAALRFVLGPELGVDAHRVEASLDGVTGRPAVFALQGVAPGPAEETRLAGIVLDNEDEPVPGATVRVRDHEHQAVVETLAGADGRFALTGVPVGTVDLEVDGTTTSRAGRWPVLHFVFDTIAGHRNELGMPVRLLPLDSGPIVGGDEDVTLSLAGVAGAELTVFANSVTFPDGSRIGEVSVTQVHGDKVPMLPPMGSGFMLAWTVQPPGAHFDPPAQISIPNMGEPPGTVVDIFSFDHDLGEFVPIGTATVSDDGTRVVSDRGSGVVKAGWHGCVPPPLAPTDVCQPSACAQCTLDGRLEPLCDAACETCDEGSCTPRRVRSVTVEALGDDGAETGDEVVVGVGQVVDFRAEVDDDCREVEYAWDLGDGNNSELEEPEHAFDEAGVYEVSLDVSCLGCSEPPTDDTLTVRVLGLDLAVRELPEEGESTPHEEEPGAFLVVNEDDDDGDGTADRDQAMTVDGEDDLVEARITFDRNAEAGTLRLEAGEGGGKILAWTAEDKAELIELPKTWDLSEPEVDVPESVWIEAVAPSAGLRDIELNLFFEAETLAEPLEDTVFLTAIGLQFEVLPDEPEDEEPYGVSADEGETEIVATVFYRSFDDPETFVPAGDGSEVELEVVEGSASLAVSAVTTESGGAVATLTTGTTAGSRSRVRGVLRKLELRDEDGGGEPIELETAAESDEIVVAPGVPFAIELTVEEGGSVRADDTATTSLRASITDQNGNAVPDDTPVSWLVNESDSPFVAAETETLGGVARATLRAPVIPRDQVVRVAAMEARAETVVQVSSVSLSVDSSASVLDCIREDQATLTVSAPGVADGTLVEWTTSNGVLSSVTTPVVGGVATTTLSARGGYPGPVVVTATVGATLEHWTGEVTAERLFTVSPEFGGTILLDLNPDTPDTLPLRAKNDLPQPTSVRLRVEGTPNTLVRLGTPGASPRAAFAFDSSTPAGTVPDLISGLDLQLGGARLDDTIARSGVSSLVLAADQAAAVPHGAPLELFGGLTISLWVRPAAPDAAILLDKPGSFTVRMADGGAVYAEVETAAGTVRVDGAATLEPGRWTRLELQAGSDRLSLLVDGESAVAALGMPPTPSSAPLAVGGGFAGHVDDLSITAVDGQGLPFELVEGSVAGLLQLDADGIGFVDLRSSGQVDVQGATASASFIIVSQVVEPLAATTTSKGLEKTLARSANKSVSEADGLAMVYTVDGWFWDQTVDVVRSFFGGDPQTTAGTVANIAGGVLIVGDVGAVVKNLWRMAGFSDKDPNYAELALSGLGLATEFAVGIGEVADVPISFAKAIVARIGNSPFADILVKRLKQVVTKGRALAQTEIDLMRLLSENLGLADHFKSVIKTDDLWEGAVKICGKFSDGALAAVAPLAGDKASGVHLRVLNQITGDFAGRFGDDVAESALLTLADISASAAKHLGRSQQLPDAIEGMGKILALSKNGSRLIDPELMTRVLDNSRILSTAYRQDELLIQLGKLDQAPGIDRLVNSLKIRSTQAKGFRYELEAAVALQETGSVVQFLGRPARIPGFTPPRYTDIDVQAGGIFYQVKRSYRALGSGEKGFNSALKWINSALVKAGGDSARVKYIVPPDVTIPRQLQELFDVWTPPIQVVRIPHKRLVLGPFEAVSRPPDPGIAGILVSTTDQVAGGLDR